MVLRLFGHPLSGCTKRVAIVLHEKGVPFEFIKVELPKGEHKAPAYLEKQPFGQVPYIDDDGYILYESRAIARYIAEKYAGQGTPGLLPTELKARGLFEQAVSVEQNHFDYYITRAVFEKVFKPSMGMTSDQAYFDGLIAQLEPKLDVYEKLLSKQKYIGGDQLTLADLFHIPYGVLLPAAGSNAIEARPNVARWLKELSERPSWQAIKDGIQSVEA